MDTWIADTEPSERFPIYTRANADEVGPDPFTPLNWTLTWEQGIVPGNGRRVDRARDVRAGRVPLDQAGDLRLLGRLLLQPGVPRPGVRLPHAGGDARRHRHLVLRPEPHGARRTSTIRATTTRRARRSWASPSARSSAGAQEALSADYLAQAAAVAGQPAGPRGRSPTPSSSSTAAPRRGGSARAGTPTPRSSSAPPSVRRSCRGSPRPSASRSWPSRSSGHSATSPRRACPERVWDLSRLVRDSRGADRGLRCRRRGSRPTGSRAEPGSGGVQRRVRRPARDVRASRRQRVGDQRRHLADQPHAGVPDDRPRAPAGRRERRRRCVPPSRPQRREAAVAELTAAVAGDEATAGLLAAGIAVRPVVLPAARGGQERHGHAHAGAQARVPRARPPDARARPPRRPDARVPAARERAGRRSSRIRRPSPTPSPRGTPQWLTLAELEPPYLVIRDRPIPPISEWPKRRRYVRGRGGRRRAPR